MEVNVHGLLFADRIITENNGKKGLIGVFSNFNFPAFPAQAPPWFIYVALDNVDKVKHIFTVNIVREQGSQVVFSGSAEFEHTEGMKGVEMILPIPAIILPGNGNYVVSIHLDNREIASRILRVLLLQRKRG